MADTSSPNEEALRRMATWVASIADRIRNPVAGIAAAVTIIDQEVKASHRDGRAPGIVVDDSLRRIRERLFSLSEYVSDLVDFARPTSVVPAPVELPQVLAALESSLPPFFRIPRLELSIAQNAAKVHADPVRLPAVLKALLLNAAEATAGVTAPRIAFRARRVSRLQRAGIEMSIEDNGPGFPEATLPRLFEPFFSTKEAGTGLGLAIARKFAEAHGGSAQGARSSELGGASVSLFLPDKSP